jgi:hypothetical protein
MRRMNAHLGLTPGRLGWAACAVLAATAGWLAWHPEPTGKRAAHLAQAPSEAPPAAQASRAWASPTAAAPRPDAAHPPELSPAQWAALQQSLAQHPQREREIQRVLAFMRLQHRLAAWQALQGGTDLAQRQALAREVILHLPTHLANRELSASEAEAILTEMAPVLAPEPEARARWMDAERLRWAAHMPATDVAEQQRARQQDEAYQREAQALSARWLATPEHERDPSALEASLQRLREQVYAGAQLVTK